MSKIDRITPEELFHNPRASLSSWLRYEPTFHLAFKQKPKAYSFEPTNMKASTVASRLRDAIRGCLAFGYPITWATHAELAQWWQESVVKHTGNKVILGPQKQVLEELKVKSDLPKNAYAYESLTFEEVTAFQLLLSTGRLLGPVIVQNPPDTTLLPQRPNVEQMIRPDGSLVLL